MIIPVITELSARTPPARTKLPARQFFRPGTTSYYEG
jgi:hypothetical protein